MIEHTKELLFKKLRSDIETKSGMRLKHRSDFLAFATLLQRETSQRLSDTTLRRFWGYQEGGKHTATIHTLDILCTYLGYKNWDKYASCNKEAVECEAAAETTAALTATNEPSEDDATSADEDVTYDADAVTSSTETTPNINKTFAPAFSRNKRKWIAACIGILVAAGGTLACQQSCDFSEDGIVYRVESYVDGRVAVAACDKEKKGRVNIPKTVSNCGRTYRVVAVDIEAFYECSGLTEVVLPAGVEEIGASAFKCCANLACISMEDGVTKMGSETFRSCPRLKDVRLSSALLELPEYCFSGDSVALTSVVLPDGIRTIGRDAFGKCKELREIHMPENLETLGRGAFWECRKLQRVTLPRTLRSIGKVAFWYCDQLQSITLNSPTPPSIESPFEDDRLTPLELHVPKDYIDEYRSSNTWTALRFAEIQATDK